MSARTLAACRYGEGSEDDAGSDEPRCRRRPRLLQQRGDPGVRGSGHYGHAAQADDLELKAEARFGKQDFRYVVGEDVYICPAGKRLAYHYTNEENGLVLRRYWTTCPSCPHQAQLHHCQRATDHALSMSTSSRRCSCRLDAHPRRRANGARRSSILRHDQSPHGSHPLPDEDAATGCRRDGAARAGL